MSDIFHGSDGVPILKRPNTDIEDVVATEPAGNTGPPTAAERLEASRSRLRAAMAPPRRLLARRGDPAQPSWLARIENLPGVRVIAAALKSWWSRHPLHPVVSLAHQTTDALVTPVARSYPIATVSAGALLGALVVTLRPWRWGAKRLLFAGLVPQILSSLPIDSWLGSLRGLEASQARARARIRAHASTPDEGQRSEASGRVVP